MCVSVCLYVSTSIERKPLEGKASKLLNLPELSSALDIKEESKNM